MSLTEDLQKIAIERIAVELEKDYLRVRVGVNDKVAEADKLKAYNDPAFADEKGKFSRDKFNAYIRTVAANIYEYKSDFAKKTVQLMEDNIGDDKDQKTLDKKAWIEILKKHEDLTTKASPVADSYTEPASIMGIPVGSMLSGLLHMFGIDTPPLSWKAIGMVIQGVFKHGFDFKAIKQDIADAANTEVAESINGVLTPNANRLMQSQLKDAVEEKLGLRAAAPQEKLEDVTPPGLDSVLNGSTGKTSNTPSTSANTGSNPPTGNNGAGTNNTGGTGAGTGTPVDVNSSVDAAIQNAIQNNDAAQAIFSLKDSKEPNDIKVYSNALALQTSFAANAKKLGANLQNGTGTTKDPKELADQALKATFDELNADQKKSMGLENINPGDTVDNVINFLKSAPATDKDALVHKKAGAFLESLRNNVQAVYTQVQQAQAAGKSNTGTGANNTGNGAANGNNANNGTNTAPNNGAPGGTGTNNTPGNNQNSSGQTSRQDLVDMVNTILKDKLDPDKIHSQIDDGIEKAAANGVGAPIWISVPLSALTLGLIPPTFKIPGAIASHVPPGWLGNPSIKERKDLSQFISETLHASIEERINKKLLDPKTGNIDFAAISNEISSDFNAALDKAMAPGGKLESLSGHKEELKEFMKKQLSDSFQNDDFQTKAKTLNTMLGIISKREMSQIKDVQPSGAFPSAHVTTPPPAPPPPTTVVPTNAGTGR